MEGREDMAEYVADEIGNDEKPVSISDMPEKALAAGGGGKDALISGILKAAQNTAESIVKEAEQTRTKQNEEISEDLERKLSRSIAKAEEEAISITERNLMLAKLDSNKLILGAKQQLIDKAYAEAKTKLMNMTDGIYREFAASLIKESAQDGDEVIISKNDKKRLNEEWLQAAAKQKGIKLTFSTETHNDAGGIVLRNKICDKNLTFEALLGEAREQTESKVVKNLFGK